MNIKALRFLLTAFIVMAFPSLASARYTIEIAKPEVVKILEPDIGSDLANKSFRQKDWLEVELKFKLKAEDTDKMFADKVTVRWYIAAKDPKKGSKKLVLLEKEVTHVNVPIGEDVYVSVYLSPNSIMRLTGSDKVSKSDFEEIGGLITVDGQDPVGTKKGFFSSSKQKVWWDSGSLSRYDKVPLLKKDETPFQNLWFSRYAELQEEK